MSAKRVTGCVTRFCSKSLFIKHFNTGDIETVQACQKFFGFALPIQLSKRAAKFENRLREITAAADLY